MSGGLLRPRSRSVDVGGWVPKADSYLLGFSPVKLCSIDTLYTCGVIVKIFWPKKYQRQKVKVSTLPHGVIGKGASLVIGIRPVRFPAPAHRFPCKKGLPLSVITVTSQLNLVNS